MKRPDDEHQIKIIMKISGVSMNIEAESDSSFQIAGNGQITRGSLYLQLVPLRRQVSLPVYASPLPGVIHGNYRGVHG
jgi:hypothetical protein